MREIESTRPLVEFMKADGIHHSGGSSRTGGRDDVKFLYTDLPTARAKAKAVGSSIAEELNPKTGKLEPIKIDGKFVVGIGLKRYEKEKGAKLGEINNQKRLTSLITGELTIDKDIEPGFMKAIQLRQFGGPVKGEPGPREKAMVSYAKDLESFITDTTSQIEENKTWVDNKGNIRTQSPPSVMRSVARQILKVLTFGKVTVGAVEGKDVLSDALFDYNDKGEATLKTFEGETGEDNRERARERISSLVRINMLKKDQQGTPRPVKFDETGMSAKEIEAKTKELEKKLNSKAAIAKRKQAAEDYIVKTALICGSNTRDMSQVITYDSGEMVVLKHNEIFDIICKANASSNPPTYAFSQGTIKITVDGKTLTIAQDGTSTAQNRETRTSVYLPKENLQDKKLVAQLPRRKTQQNNSNFQDFVQGQIKLLETFLTQTT